MGFPARSQHPTVCTAFADVAPVLPPSPAEMQRSQPPFDRGKREDLLKVTQQVRCRQGLGPGFNTQSLAHPGPQTGRTLCLVPWGKGLWAHRGEVMGWEAGAGRERSFASGSLWEPQRPHL